MNEEKRSSSELGKALIQTKVLMEFISRPAKFEASEEVNKEFIEKISWSLEVPTWL